MPFSPADWWVVECEAAWCHNEFNVEPGMAVNFSVKNVPDEVAERLRERARRNHRSLQGELLTILEDAVARTPRTLQEVRENVKALGLQTPDEAAATIRETGDGR